MGRPTIRRVSALAAVAVLAAVLAAVAEPEPPPAAAHNEPSVPECNNSTWTADFGTPTCYVLDHYHYSILSFWSRITTDGIGTCNPYTGQCRQTTTTGPCDQPSQSAWCNSPGAGWANYSNNSSGPYGHYNRSSATFGCQSGKHRHGRSCHRHPLSPPSNWAPYCGIWTPHNGTISPSSGPVKHGVINPSLPAHNNVDLGPCGVNPPTTTRRPTSTTTTVPGTLPELSVAGQTVDEGDGAADFTITLSAAATSAVTVVMDTSDGTATAGSDYASVSRTVTIPASSTTAIVSVTVTDDTADEPDETFTLTLSNPSNANLAAISTATATIRDDDAAPAVPTNVVFECTSSGGVFTLNASWDPPAAGVSEYQTQLSSNPVAWGSTGELYFGFGSATSMTATAPSAGTYYAVIWPYGVPGVGVGVQVQASTECELPPTVSVTDAADVREGLALVFAVSLSAASSSDVTVHATAVGVTAIAGDDFLAHSRTATISAGSTSVDVRVFTTYDSDVELDETLQLVLSAPSGATLGTSTTATGRILDDDDPAVSLPVTALTVTEGSSVQVTATLDQAPLAAGSVRFSTSGAVGGASSCGVGDDYAVSGSLFSFAAGVTTASVTLTACDDTDATNETVTLTLVAAGISGLHLGTPTTVDITINDTSLTPLQQCEILHGPGWAPVLHPDGTPWTDPNGQIICAQPH